MVVFYKNEVIHGQVVNKYPDSRHPKRPPRFLMRTDRKIDNNPNAFLGGFGLELSVENSQFQRFENEADFGDKFFGYYRLMTFQEAWDDCEPLDYLE